MEIFIRSNSLTYFGLQFISLTQKLKHALIYLYFELCGEQLFIDNNQRNVTFKTITEYI